MKRVISLILILVLCFGLSGCTKTYHGTEELMKKARKEIPISDADTIEMSYAGMCRNGDKAIAWFVSGSENQAHYYLPMEIEIKGNGSDYTFVTTNKANTDRCSDVAILIWQRGYVFLINNPKVATVQMTLQNGEVIKESITKDMIPHTFYVDSLLSEYLFLDTEGHEVK